MKIKCNKNQTKDLPEEIRNRQSYDVLPLIIGKEYIVYALSEFFNDVWFCICDENHINSFPMWRPSMFFEVTDSRLSRYWVFSFQEDSNNKKRPFFSYSEWANNDFYYDSLTEDEDIEVEIFETYKKLMDLEFPDNSIKEIAQIGDEKWLICTSCLDAWESSDSRDALVICPYCQIIQNNPRYKDVFPSSI